MRPPPLQLFKLEDQPWLPHFLRCGITDYLAEITERTRLYAAVLPALTASVAQTSDPLIRDFVSGGGGAWPALLSALASAVPGARLELTDAYPNPQAIAQFPSHLSVKY